MKITIVSSFDHKSATSAGPSLGGKNYAILVPGASCSFACCCCCTGAIAQ